MKFANNKNRLGVLEHEFGHHFRLGDSNIEMLKARKLLKDQPELERLAIKNKELNYGDIKRPEHYLEREGELYNNLRDVSRDLKLQIGQPYPGVKDFTKTLKNFKGTNRFVIDALRLNNPRDYKRTWDAMTGRYFIAPAAIGTSLFFNRD